LILNQGQPYKIEIQAEQQVQSLCLFFQPGIVEETHRSLTAKPETLLDNPKASAPTDFFERTYPRDPALFALLQRIQQHLASRYIDTGWLEEQFHWIILKLLDLHQQVYAEIDTLRPARASTREELYRHLHYARDYLEASFSQQVSLEDAARVACLSPNYFLRTFKETFHQTPHQYVISRRLEQAQHLLSRTECSVTEICLSVGFTSLGTFSWLFRRRFGLSPGAYRRARR
jgi:AraC family transcriptional regulator